MDLGIAGRRAAVAASSAGLGFATGRALLGEGVRVAINGRDPERLAAALRNLGELTDRTGASCTAIAGDVGSPEGATAFVEAARAELGGLDILVANSGGPPPGTFASTTIDDYRSGLEQTLLATVAMCQAAVPAMVAQGWGRVLIITSIGARQPIPQLMASVTARTAVTGFAKVLATEIASSGVTVNTVQPGSHATDRLRALHGSLDEVATTIPVGFVGDPDDFGAVCAFLCSQQARFVTGSAVPVEGGASRALL